MNIHIIGSSGYIGKKLIEKIPKNCSVYTYSRNKEDIHVELTEKDTSYFKHIEKDDFVIFLSAVSSPDECDKNYDYAYQVNVIGTIWFIRNCIDRGANVLFLSSDVVNGPCEDPAYEDFVVKPFGKYAQMKFEVEDTFKDEKCFKVFRLSYVFSREDKFMKYLDACVSNGKQADVFDALFRSVVYVEDILDGILALKSNFAMCPTSVYNFSGPHLLSRADLAALYKRNVNCLLEYTLSVPPPEFFDARPNTIYTKSYFLEMLLNRLPTSIEEAMKKEFA